MDLSGGDKVGKRFYSCATNKQIFIASQKRYCYDKMAYTLKCIIVDENGTLKLTQTMTDASGNETTVATFTNSYNSGDEINTSENTSKSSSGGTGTTAGPVKTGDNTNIIGYITVLILSMGVLAFFALKKRKKR